METNNKIEALKLHLDETPNTANYTVKQSEWDDDLFIVEFTYKIARINDVIDNAIQITEGLKFSFDENVIKKEYLVLTDCETEDRWDENLWNSYDTKINETAAMSFNAVDEAEYNITYDDVGYNIYELKTGEL